MTRLCRVGGVDIGPGKPLAIIAGPCVLESLQLGMDIAGSLRDASKAVGLTYIFKASFDKANRSSISSARGPGLEMGMEWMTRIAGDLSLPTTTDIHSPDQAEPAARVVNLLQIPAFLCRQTDLLIAAGHAAQMHGRGVNVKKGQFLSPREMGGPVRKLAEAGCTNVMLTERGTFFGYNRLVNDFIGLGDMIEGTEARRHEGTKGDQDGNPPVCFDCTHSTQTPGTGEQTGGRPERAPLLARAATAAGVHALFIECHPEPTRAMSDASTMLRLDQMPALLNQVAAIRRALSA